MNRRALYCILLLVVCLIPALHVWAGSAAGQNILLEAEQFTDLGGWDLDQQSMDQMGSPYLLAHGLGVPVHDAVNAASV